MWAARRGVRKSSTARLRSKRSTAGLGRLWPPQGILGAGPVGRWAAHARAVAQGDGVDVELDKHVGAQAVTREMSPPSPTLMSHYSYGVRHFGRGRCEVDERARRPGSGTRSPVSLSAARPAFALRRTHLNVSVDDLRAGRQLASRHYRFARARGARQHHQPRGLAFGGTERVAVCCAFR